MLTGDLHEFDAVEVLGLLGRCRRPGALLVEGEGTGVIYCAGGDITFATTQAQTTAGDVLVAQGYLGADDWSTALASADPPHAVAEALAVRGTDPVRLSRLLRTHTEEAVFELGLWRSGTFRFEGGVDHPLADTFRFPVEPLLRSVEARAGCGARGSSGCSRPGTSSPPRPARTRARTSCSAAPSSGSSRPSPGPGR